MTVFGNMPFTLTLIVKLFSFDTQVPAITVFFFTFIVKVFGMQYTNHMTDLFLTLIVIVFNF